MKKRISKGMVTAAGMAALSLKRTIVTAAARARFLNDPKRT
jgi:hypothetical protein